MSLLELFQARHREWERPTEGSEGGPGEQVALSPEDVLMGVQGYSLLAGDSDDYCIWLKVLRTSAGPATDTMR